MDLALKFLSDETQISNSRPARNKQQTADQQERRRFAAQIETMAHSSLADPLPLVIC